jgi:ubiquitin C-terminal hydrolase
VALINDACGLHVVVQELTNVYATFTSKTERRAASIVASDPEADLTNLLGQDWGFLKMLLAFSDCHAGQFSNSDSSGYPISSDMLCYISESAIDLLMSLPMCNLMKTNVISDLKEENMDGIKRMVSGHAGDISFSASALLYICIILNSQISPMDGVGVSPESLICSPLGLLKLIAGAFTKTNGLLRDKLARVCTHLILSMASMSEKSPVFVEELQMFSLAMTNHPELLCALNDSVFIVSGSLRVVLETCREQSNISNNVMKEYVTTTKMMLQSECGQVRRLASEGILIMSQEHGLEDLVFDNIVSDVLLLRDPSNEQIELCINFLHRMHRRRSNDMAIIANTISSSIATCLSEKCNISGHSRCLQVAVLHIYSEDIPALINLIPEILQKYLFVGTDMISSKQEKDVYSRVLNDSRYSLQQQDALYRVLITGALLFEKCWDSVYYRLSEIFRSSTERCSQTPHANETRLIHSLRDLNDYCGLLNGGATCYMNATFQQLFMQPRLRQLLLSLPMEENEGTLSPIFEALRDVFITMCGGLGKVVNPSCFWRSFKDYDGNPVNVREHQDAYEFFTRLQDSVDEYLKSVGHPKVIHSVFGGSFNQIIEVPGQADLRSEREEEFYQISVDVRGKKGLLESLESYVAPETLDGQNQWFCEKIGRKVDAKKRTLIKKLPESLMFHFKRFEWDFETLSRWKIKDRFEFPTMIDMAPYVDSPESHQESMMYELSGIIVHSGTAFAGHYYSFAKERSSGRWFIFDDDSVAPWDISNIDDDCFGGSFIPDGSSKTYQRSQSAYIIMYDRVCEKQTSPPACGFLDMFESIPPKSLSQIIESNLTELNKAFAFHPSLANFICEVARELNASCNGPRALKTKKFEGVHQIEQQGSNGVFYSHDRREDGNHPVQVKQALLLCLKYICNIMIYDAVPSRGDSPEHDPALRLLDSLQHVCSIPSLARVVLDPSDIGEQSPLGSYINALTSPSKRVRDLIREIVTTSVKALLNSPAYSDESLILCHSWIEKLTNRVSYSLQNFSLATQKWKDLITCLHDISCDKLGKSLLVEYVDALVSFSPTIHKIWRQQTKGQKLEDNFAVMYTNLVLPLLRMHKLENQDTASDLQQSNPFILRLSYGSNIKNCPALFPVNDGYTVAMIVKGLLLPGAVSSTECMLFMKWFAWEHKDRSDALVAAILLHIEDSANLVDFASEVASIVDLLSMEDSYTASRVLTFLLGVDFDSADPIEPNLAESILGALDACSSSGSLPKAYLIVCICLATKMSCPEVWSAIERDASLRHKLSQWIVMSKRICLHISHKITRDPAFRKQWTDMIPAVTNNQMESFFDPAVLFDQFQRFPEHLNDTNLLHTNNQAMIGENTDLVPSESTEHIQDVVCIKASHEEDEDDEVAEIDIPEA